MPSAYPAHPHARAQNTAQQFCNSGVHSKLIAAHNAISEPYFASWIRNMSLSVIGYYPMIVIPSMIISKYGAERVSDSWK